MPFPDFPQVAGESSITIEGGVEAERMSNGALRVRRMWPTTEATEMVIVHVLTTAQWNTLWSHWTSNSTGQDTIRWRETNETYTVRYLGPPTRRRVGNMWHVTFRVAEV